MTRLNTKYNRNLKHRSNTSKNLKKDSLCVCVNFINLIYYHI